jgi:hypothetical protein
LIFLKIIGAIAITTSIANKSKIVGEKISLNEVIVLNSLPAITHKKFKGSVPNTVTHAIVFKGTFATAASKFITKMGTTDKKWSIKR